MNREVKAMMTMTKSTRSMQVKIHMPRVEIVDNWHRRWQLVLRLVKRMGHGSVLKLDPDGWLSARQSVVAAMINDRPVGFLCFHIHPIHKGQVEARLDALAVDCQVTGRVADTITRALIATARQHGQELHCSAFKGLDEITG